MFTSFSKTALLHEAKKPFPADDLARLSLVVMELEKRAQIDPSYLEPLVLGSDRLANDERFVVQAIETLQKAANNPRITEETERRAARFFAQHIGSLSSPMGRTKAFFDGARFSSEESIFRTTCLKGLIREARKLEDSKEKTKYLRRAIFLSPRESELEQDALTAFKEELLPQPLPERCEAYLKGALYAPHETRIERQFIDSFTEQTNELPTALESLAIYYNAASQASKRSYLKQQSVLGILGRIDDLKKDEKLHAILKAARIVDAGTEAEGKVIDCFFEYAASLSEEEEDRTIFSISKLTQCNKRLAEKAGEYIKITGYEPEPSRTSAAGQNKPPQNILG